ncbi:hypothetical protein [Sphingomonas sp.]
MKETHTILAALTHRRYVDPIIFAKRKTPFIIERPCKKFVDTADKQEQ